jgi:succinate-acetate transporter protein
MRGKRSRTSAGSCWPGSTQLNTAVFAVFLTLEVTEVILFIGFFTGSSGTIKAGGYVGIVTAVVAWYTSAAGVANGVPGPVKLPVGPPLLT